MKKNNKGFVVSAVLYPLLVLFLALIMGLLAMTDTRKRILDKMKLEISDSIFDEATCSCDTILNKLNYLIKNGVGGGGGGGSYSQNVLGLNVKTYESPVDIPSVGNNSGDIAVITEVEMPDNNYYVSTTAPQSPKNGTIWIVQDRTSNYYITSDYSKIGISYVMQYICDENNSNCEWQIKKAYVQDDAQWKMLYYVSMKDGIVDLTKTDINAEIVKTYSYTGKYQTFTTVFSGYYKIELWGAQGATSSRTGGLGSYTKGEIYLNAGDTLYIYVGGQGSGKTGGWNGGGNGSSVTGSGDGGGGSTDVRLIGTTNKDAWNEFESLKSRIMVAAGGSGGSQYNGYVGDGRAGGGLYGTLGLINGSAESTMKYGTQISGGENVSFPSANGGFGYGGDAHVGTYNGGGGGGGYYGGAGGRSSNSSSTGSSGSSYISGHIGCNSILEQSMSNNIMHSGSGYHYSGKYFIDTVMIDGYGYKWNSFKEGQVNMPTHDGKSTMTGNSGNGYAKITLKSINVIEQEEIDQIRLKQPFVAYYEYSGSYQQLQIEKTGHYKIELWGAQGATSSRTGGLGAYTKGEIYLNAGDTLYIYVGGQGSGKTGGWNGGGNGSSGNGSGDGGGGSTDIRLVSTYTLTDWGKRDLDSLKSRIMVAAGGSGGSKYNGYVGDGRAGGGLYGTLGLVNGSAESTMKYGTQISGGENVSFPSANGSFGYGGDAHVGTYNGGGGGGGYYGGAGGRSNNSSSTGSSGSSYISGHAGCIAVTSEGLPKTQTYTTLTDSIHYTNMKFTNTTMVDGYGYQWTTVKGNALFYMPSYDEKSTMTGNSGNGYAKITYIGV